MKIADMDRDGDADIVITSQPLFVDDTPGSSPPEIAVALLLNDGSGSFGSFLMWDIENNASAVSVADFDSDGNLDLVLASSIVSLLLNPLVSTSPGESVVYEAADFAGFSCLVARDYDGDGDADLVLCNPGLDSVSVLSNNGRGQFSATTLQVGDEPFMDFAREEPRSAVVADFTGDGCLDIVIANRISSRGSMFVSDCDMGFLLPAIAFSGLGACSLADADFDGDGYRDLAGADPTRGWIALNDGEGMFTTVIDLGLPLRPDAILATDLSGDGLADLVAVRWLSNEILVLINAGAGAFAPAMRLYTLNANPVALAEADVDGDSDIDLVVLNSGLSEILVFRNQRYR